jgi:hypothetical protein
MAGKVLRHRAGRRHWLGALPHTRVLTAITPHLSTPQLSTQQLSLLLSFVAGCCGGRRRCPKVSAAQRSCPKGFHIVSNSRQIAALALLAALVAAGCQRNPLLVKRSPCPAVAVPTYAGDVTLFRPGAAPGADAASIDVVAAITNLRETCTETEASFRTDVTYDVLATRLNVAGARTVTLPVFATVVQGGNLLVSKEVAAVEISFADGQARATGRGGARANVARAAASLPPEIQAKVSRRRKAGDLDAASDPLAEPEVRAALRAASFELLVGFQLGEAALAYNVTK